MKIELDLTVEQHQMLRDVALREQQSPEEWALECVLGVAELYAQDAGRPAAPRPRRLPSAVTLDRGAPRMIRCPHCRISTRAVERCDNCDRSLT